MLHVSPELLVRRFKSRAIKPKEGVCGFSPVSPRLLALRLFTGIPMCGGSTAAVFGFEVGLPGVSALAMRYFSGCEIFVGVGQRVLATYASGTLLSFLA